VSARVEPETPAPLAIAPNAALGAAAPLPVTIDADDRWGGHQLPNDHPAWMKDTLSISQRARAMLVKVRPVVVKVVACWQHHVRSILVSGRRISVDASGSYRLD
jgi:hypothetical protein